MILSPQQQKVMDALIPVAEIATSGVRTGMQILPRCQTLIIGPSGSGKSHLAQRIAHELGLPCLVINVGSWILTSSRAEPWTFTVICEWLGQLRSGGLLVIDEIDKCSGDAEWSNYLRTELFSLLDGSIPACAKMPDAPDFTLDMPAPEAVRTEREYLAGVLREKVMIIGCGAWQSAWRGNSRQLGFGAEKAAGAVEIPTREQILGSISCELRQRFRDEISVLPPMGLSDYLTVANAIAQTLPPKAQTVWRLHLEAAIRTGLEGTLGMRIFEELLLKTLIITRKTPVPPQFFEVQDSKSASW